jgi:hypothetical protein
MHQFDSWTVTLSPAACIRLRQRHHTIATDHIENRAIRELLTVPVGGLPVTQRHLLLDEFAALEAENRHVREKLAHSAREVEELHAKVVHGSTLEASFEAIKQQMKRTKAQLQAEVDKKHLENIRKDEEILQLRARSQIIVRTSADTKAAVHSAVKEIKRAASADLASANAIINSVKATQKQQRKAFKVQIRADRQKLQRLEGSLQLMATELLKKEEQLANVR